MLLKEMQARLLKRAWAAQDRRAAARRTTADHAARG